MKILIVAQYFPPDITAAAFRIYDTARLLEDHGHEVHVITAYPHRSSAKGASLAEYDSQVSRVRRARVARLNGGGFRNYITHYCSFMIGSSWLGLRQRLAGWKPDVVWASSPPLFVGLSGVALSRLFSVPLVVDIRDIWPASAVGTGQLTEGGRAYRIGTRMEQYVYDRATHITCVARPMQDYIRSRTQTPVTVVYNGTRAGDIIPSVTDQGSDSGHVLLYAGNLGRAQQLDLLIRAWANVSGREGCSGWMVKLLGSGAVEQELQDLAAEMGVSETLTFSPPVARGEAMRQMRAASALCVSLQPNKAFARTIPSKIFDCMAMGRPVLAGVCGEARTILASTGANLCYEPGDQRGLEEALKTLMHDYERLRQSAGRNAELIRTSYTRRKAVETLTRVLEAVVDGPSSTVAERGFDIDLGPSVSHGQPAPPSGDREALGLPIAQTKAQSSEGRSTSGVARP